MDGDYNCLCIVQLHVELHWGLLQLLSEGKSFAGHCSCVGLSLAEWEWKECIRKISIKIFLDEGSCILILQRKVSESDNVLESLVSNDMGMVLIFPLTQRLNINILLIDALWLYVMYTYKNHDANLVIYLQYEVLWKSCNCISLMLQLRSVWWRQQELHINIETYNHYVRWLKTKFVGSQKRLIVCIWHEI
jgi:hypothetical protein